MSKGAMTEKDSSDAYLQSAASTEGPIGQHERHQHDLPDDLEVFKRHISAHETDYRSVGW